VGIEARGQARPALGGLGGPLAGKDLIGHYLPAFFQHVAFEVEGREAQTAGFVVVLHELAVGVLARVGAVHQVLAAGGSLAGLVVGPGITGAAELIVGVQGERTLGVAAQQELVGPGEEGPVLATVEVLGVEHVGPTIFFAGLGLEVVDVLERGAPQRVDIVALV
jgi:hypothetical protein